MPERAQPTEEILAHELGQAHTRAFGARDDGVLNGQINAAAHAVWMVSQSALGAMEAEPDFVSAAEADRGAS